MPPRVSKNSSKAAGGPEQNSHQRDSLDQNATASALASARARLKKWIRMPPILQIVDPIYEAALSFHENKPYLIYAVVLYCLICFAFPFPFLEMLWHLVVKYFIDTPRDWCFSLSHFIMTTLMAWDPRFYVDYFFNSGLLPVLDLFIPMRVEVDSESMTKPFMRSAMWNATAAQTMAEYPSSSVMEQLNDTQKRIRQLQEWINGNATAMNNFTHALTEPEIKDMFDKNHRFLLQIRHSASEFMCGMRIGEDSKAIAHLHAVTMVNCIFIYIALFLACTRLKMRRNVYVQYSIRLISGIFSIALLNCFAFPTPLVRTMPFHFSDLCINTRSASKLLAETFEPYICSASAIRVKDPLVCPLNCRSITFGGYAGVPFALWSFYAWMINAFNFYSAPWSFRTNVSYFVTAFSFALFLFVPKMSMLKLFWDWIRKAFNFMRSQRLAYGSPSL